jgi:hypothetical protein
MNNNLMPSSGRVSAMEGDGPMGSFVRENTKPADFTRESDMLYRLPSTASFQSVNMNDHRSVIEARK